MIFGQWIDLVLVLVGIGTILYHIPGVAERFFGVEAEKPEEKPAPKPREFHVRVEDEDGWPLRSFSVPIKTAAGVVRQLERQKYG